MSDDTWDEKVNAIIKSPLCDIRGIFRTSKLYIENRDADEFGRFYEVIKTLIRQILRRNGLNEEKFSKPVDWKIKISEGCEMEFTSLEERYREINNFLQGKNFFHVPSLLILGETGCGKSLLAGVAASVIMPDKKLARVNISSYDTNSIDIMLFGAKEGSFTSSKEDIPGIFIEHCGEVILLDEIGDMNLESQTCLLTYMDNAQVLPRGMTDSICSPCIIIAATNKDVKNDKSFRTDIFNRFDHIIEIPSLRERKQDLRPL